MKSKFLKGALVVVGAILFSTVGIFAADTLNGVDRSLVGLSGTGAGLCRSGMTLVKNGDNSFCIDMFEASPSNGCAYNNPASVLETETNTSNLNCTPNSSEGRDVWRYVSLTQAQRMCAAVGKRLPTSDEWYTAALGTPSEECVITTETNPEKSGSRESCISASGAYDMVGNAWEWVDETVTNGSFAERQLPGSGYVASVDASGVAITTENAEQILFGSDYFWSKQEGIFGMIRGGFYGGGKDAGLYAINASVQTSFASAGLGFRCVEDII